MKNLTRALTVFCLFMAALAIAIFLLPVSRWMALTAFVLVLWIAWPRRGGWDDAVPDRFRESEKVARRILASAGL